MSKTTGKITHKIPDLNTEKLRNINFIPNISSFENISDLGHYQSNSYLTKRLSNVGEFSKPNLPLPNINPYTIHFKNFLEKLLRYPNLFNEFTEKAVKKKILKKSNATSIERQQKGFKFTDNQINQNRSNTEIRDCSFTDRTNVKVKSYVENINSLISASKRSIDKPDKGTQNIKRKSIIKPLERPRRRGFLKVCIDRNNQTIIDTFIKISQEFDGDLRDKKINNQKLKEYLLLRYQIETVDIIARHLFVEGMNFER